MQGSGAQPYILRNVAGVYSCSCPAWRNQSAAIERRSCKHLRQLRGDAIETARVGTAAAPARAARTAGAAQVSATGTAPPILLAHPWDQVVDLSGWWMSEKLDGVRAYWDGTRFLSRLGNQFHAPDWFIADLPKDVILDGELWAGRKKFQRGVSIARRQDKSDDWRELTYVVFDAPAHDAAFEQRLEHVRQLMEASGSQHARWLPHERCTGLDHLRAELARVEELGGEGLMMRQPGSRYEVGRSWTLRKVKTFHDAEARVIAHVRGAGRHGGRLGSLQCELPNGKVFNVGTGLSDAERNNPPPVGTVVTFRYQELSNDGVPRFPSYVGVRDDVAWPPTDTPAPAPAPARARAAAPARAAQVTASPTTRRTFTRGDDVWSIELDGRTVKIRSETPGTEAEDTTRHSPNPAAAWRDADSLIAAKLRDGYVEIVA
ncbi:MAG: DNA ligase [Deltaproteobacteria bacterium]|nr:DNA ligase [Deltaproteobacteria bacterium]